LWTSNASRPFFIEGFEQRENVCMILESRLGISVKQQKRQENEKGELTVCLKMVTYGWRLQDSIVSGMGRGL